MKNKTKLFFASIAAFVAAAFFSCATEKRALGDTPAQSDLQTTRDAGTRGELVLVEEGTPGYELVEACQERDFSRVRELIEKEGVNPNSSIGGMSTLTVCLCGEPDRKLLRYLLKHGANPNVVEKPLRNSPLSWASSNRDLESAKILLAAGADPNLAGVLLTPMYQAHMNKDQAMMDALAKAGAKPVPPPRYSRDADSD